MHSLLEPDPAKHAGKEREMRSKWLDEGGNGKKWETTEFSNVQKQVITSHISYPLLTISWAQCHRDRL